MELTTVPYKGTGPALTDLMGGQVDFMCDQTTNTTPQIKGGKVKAYAVTTRQRVASLPDLPTMEEAGLKGFEVGVWHGICAQGNAEAGHRQARGRAADGAEGSVDHREVRRAGRRTGPRPRATPAALDAHLKSEIAKWQPIIKKAGIYAD